MLRTAFEEQDMHRFRIFLKLPLSVTPIRIIPVIKRLRNLGRIQFIAKSSSIYTKICLCHKHKTFGEVGGNSPLQLSSRTHFAKIEDKKSYCEKLSLKTLLEFSGLSI